MSEFLAEAQVVVRANTKLFLADFQKAVAKVEATKVTVTVRASMAGFRNDLVAKLRSSERGLVVNVKVRPDMTGFRTALQAAVLRSSKGVIADVGVRAGAVAPGAAVAGAATAPAATPRRRVATAEEAGTQAVQAGIFARKQINGLIDEQEKRLARIARQEEAISAAQKAQTLAIHEQNAALQIQAVDVERRARAELAVTQGAFGKEAARRSAPSDVAAQAAADAAAQDKIQKEMNTAFAAREAERTKIAQDNARKRTADLDAFERQQAATDERALLAEKAANRERLSEEAAFARKRATLEKAVAPIAAIPGQSAVAATQKRVNTLLKAEAASHEIANAARRAGLPTIAKEIELLGLEAGALAKVAEADHIAAVAAAERGAAFRAAGRATEAQLLSIVGLRGAALSAQNAFLLAAAGTIVFTKAIKDAAATQSLLAVFKVTAGATADEMERVSETARKLGRDVTLPGVSAHDAAEALTELSKAGLSVQDSIEGARGVLQLATAAGIDNAQAVTLAASALNAFGLAGSEASHVADVLANSANRSQGSITDAGVALQQSSAVARQAGLSLEDTAAALTLFARAGLRGSDAGTSLRTALIRLINPSTKAAALIQKLGLNIRDSQGNINLNVFDEFTQKTKDFSAAARDQALAIIFGQDAIRGAAILAREGRSGLEAELKAIERNGTAAEVAAARVSGFSGSLENLKNQLSDVGETIGASLLPSLAGFIDIISNSIQTTGKLIDAVEQLNDVASKPIDIVVNFIRKVVPGGGGGGDGEDTGEPGAVDRIRRLFDPHESGIEFIQDANALGIGLGAALDEGLQSALRKAGIPKQIADNFKFIPGLPTLDEAQSKIQQILKDLRASPGPTGFNQAVIDLQNLQNKLQGGTADSKALADQIGPLVKQLQELGTQNVIHIPVDFQPGKLLTSETLTLLQQEGEKGGKLTAEAFAAGFLGSVEDIGKRGADALKAVARGAVDPGVAGAFTEAGKKVTQALGQGAGFERAATQARLKGDVAGQIKAFEGVAESQRKAIAAINRVTGGAPTGDRLAARTKAENALGDALDQIKSLRESQNSEAEKKASDIKKAQDDADQKILDALAPATRRLDTRALIAEGTESVKDDIAIAKAQQADNLRQIAVIQKSFNDRKAAAEKIADLRDDNIKLGQQIAADTQTLFEQKDQRLAQRQSDAEAVGDINGQIRIVKLRIRRYNELIRSFHGEKEALQKLLDARDNLRRDRDQLFEDKQQAQIDFAQSVFDLTGNKNPLLRALNTAIANQRQDIAAAKKAGRSTLALRTELNKLLLQRKNLLKDAEDGAKEHTTAFDLLKEFNANFNNIAGNVINTDQPFAGSSAFSTDIVNKAISGFAQTGLPHRPIDIRLRGDDPTQTKQISVTEKLIAVIQENTDVLRGGGGNRSTQSVFVPGEIEGKNKLAAFWAARQAREVHDG